MNALRSKGKSNPRRRPTPHAVFVGLCCLLLTAVLWTRELQADGLEGRFEVRSADLQLKDGVYQTGDALPVVRSGGPGDYFQILPENKFVMMRPGA